MKIFAIRNEEDKKKRDLGYLIYYEKEKKFYIELPDDADPWETPLLLSSCLKRGEKTVNAYWSKNWVQQRIVPSDRQNLGSILKDNGLDYYDEFKLLTLAHGRCAQDSYYLTAISEKKLPAFIAERNSRLVKSVTPLPEYTLVIIFMDGSVRKCKLSKLVKNDRRFSPVLNNERIFNSVRIETGGYGICWGENLCISKEELYQSGEKLPLSWEDLKHLICANIMDGTEAADELNCSKQNIDYLIKKQKLQPVKEGKKYRLFMKSDLQWKEWKINLSDTDEKKINDHK